MQDSPERLELQDVSVEYGGKIALDHLTFSVPHGARVAVVGPNGAGKSTLFKALVGLIPLRDGKIFVHGLPLGNHKDCVAYVPQREEVDWRFPVSVRDVVMMGRYDHQNWIGAASRQDKRVVSRSLAQMGIAQLSDRSISELSGGEQQRVFLARALAQEPHILLLDEPFTGVDMPTQESTLRLLDDLRAEDVTAMIATHDIGTVVEKFDLMLLLNRRLIAFGPPAEVMRQQNISQAFGSRLTVLPDGTMIIDEH